MIGGHMERSRVKFLLPGLGLGLALCFASGCGNLNPFDEVWLPWQVQDDHYETAAERIARYQAMGQSAKTLSPDAQERQSQQLADVFHSERDPQVRAAAVLAAANFPTATAKAILLTSIRDADVEIRKASCAAWGRRGDKDAVAVLSDVLESDDDRDVRLVAVTALGGIKDPATVPVLAKRLEDTDVAVQHRAMRSLENVTDRYHGNNVEAWQQFARGENISSETPSIAERFRRLVH